jgi:hypothetical protein
VPFKRETIVKKPGWLRWGRSEDAESKSETLRKIRRRTDQKIRQDALKDPGEAAQNKASKRSGKTK